MNSTKYSPCHPEAPYIVLGTYKPKKYRASIIGKWLTDFTGELGLKPLVDGVHGAQMTSIWADADLHAEVRRFAQHGQGSDWHQDGDQAPGSNMDHAAVLWAAVTPTQFKYHKVTNDITYQPEPFEIVIVRNLCGMHRSPPDAPKKPIRRWFFRQRIEVPTHMELL